MSLLKRKSAGDPSGDPAHPQKQLKEALSEVVACVHDVSYPEGYVPAPQSETSQGSKPAKEFPFTLDPFQSEAIRCLDNGESVMVILLLMTSSMELDL